MQVEVKPKPEAFNPIELKITIENEKELKFLREIFTLTITVPKQLVDYKVIEEEDCDTVVKIMQEILYKLPITK
jgi:hypothetical protein